MGNLLICALWDDQIRSGRRITSRYWLRDACAKRILRKDIGDGFGDRSLAILEMLLGDLADGDALPHHLIAAGLDQVDIDRADRVSNRVHVSPIRVARPCAVTAVAVITAATA